jgi:hypothetical protein
MTVIVRFVMKVLWCVPEGIFRRSAANGGPVDVQLRPANNVSDSSLHCPCLSYHETLPPPFTGQGTGFIDCEQTVLSIGSGVPFTPHMGGETDRKTLSLFIFHGMTAAANDSLQETYQSCFCLTEDFQTSLSCPQLQF